MLHSLRLNSRDGSGREKRLRCWSYDRLRVANDMRSSRTRLLLIGQVLTNKLKEGSTWTSCKPKPKDLFALCEYVCLYIHSLACAYMYITSWHHTIAFSITISRISRVLLMQGYVEPDVYQRARGFSSKQMPSKIKYNNLNQGLWPTWHGELDSRGKTSTGAKFSNQRSKFNL